MLAPLAAVLLGISDPGSIVREATRAADGDSVAAVAARWRARLAADPADRPAALGLATLLRLTYRLADADSAYRHLIASAHGADPVAAYAALGRAEIAISTGPLDTAAARARDAIARARAAHESSAESEALLTEGLARARLPGGFPDAMRLLDTAVGVARDTTARAVALCQRAFLKTYAGRPEAGREARQGLALARAAGAPRTVAVCLQILGAREGLGSDDRATDALYDSAATMQRALHDHEQDALTLRAVAAEQLSRGNHTAALRAAELGLAETVTSGNRLAEAWLWRDLGLLAVHIADLDAATMLLDRSEHAMRQIGDAVGLLAVRDLQDGVALERGDVDRAEADYRDEAAIGERIGIPLLTYSAHLGLVRVAMRRGDWVAARAEIVAMRRAAAGHGMSGYEDGMRYEVGLVALRTGAFDEAERSFRAYLSTASAGDYLQRYSARARLAAVAAARGALDSAEHELIVASDALDAERATADERSLRALAFQTRLGFGDPDVGVPDLLAQLAFAGRTATAFRLAEHRRARALADALARTVALPGADSSRALPRAPVGAASADLAGVLGANHAALIEYVTGRTARATTVFVVSSRGLGVVRAPPIDTLAPDIDHLLVMIDAHANVAAPARRLGRALLDSALMQIPDDVRHLIIVPDDVLHSLPFDLLRLADGRLVIDRYAVSSAPSASVVATLMTRTRATDPARTLVMADPRGAGAPADNGRIDSVASVFRTPTAWSALAPLPGAAREARLVARYAPTSSEVRVGSDATEAWLAHARLDGFRIIHFAAHALVDDRVPARSALVLAAGDGEDGLLSAGDIASLRLRADLVVLSACRSAEGRIVRGEGIEGLTAPFLAAGARTVVATLWEVRDDETRRLMSDFYRHLAEGLNVTDALRTAKRDAAARGVPASDWAAFTVVGDPAVTLPLEHPSLWTRLFSLGR